MVIFLRENNLIYITKRGRHFFLPSFSYCPDEHRVLTLINAGVKLVLPGRATCRMNNYSEYMVNWIKKENFTVKSSAETNSTSTYSVDRESFEIFLAKGGW